VEIMTSTSTGAPREPPTRATSSRVRAPHVLFALAALCLVLVAAGCGGTGQPRPLAAGTLAEAETFPYFRVYWAGPTFAGHTLAAADGQANYDSGVGDSVYYGDCVHRKGIFGGGNCLLPLQVTTVIYGLHSNSALGPQRNTVVRGVPAVVYDEGRSIELYSGRLAVDIFSDTFAHAYSAALQLRPLNAPGSATENLPAPVFCPGLSGPINAQVSRVMANLPGHACQHAAAAEAQKQRLLGIS
jgi:hypothetical protein